jgi:hypothetical protein
LVWADPVLGSSGLSRVEREIIVWSLRSVLTGCQSPACSASCGSTSQRRKARSCHGDPRGENIARAVEKATANRCGRYNMGAFASNWAPISTRNSIHLGAARWPPIFCARCTAMADEIDSIGQLLVAIRRNRLLPSYTAGVRTWSFCGRQPGPERLCSIATRRRLLAGNIGPIGLSRTSTVMSCNSFKP